MNQDEQTLVFGGFVLFLLGLIAFVMGNVLASLFLGGLGLIIVAVIAGFIKELFDMCVRIFESIVDAILGR